MSRASTKPLPFARFSDQLVDVVCEGVAKVKADPKAAFRPVTFLAILAGVGIAGAFGVGPLLHEYTASQMRTLFFDSHKDVLLRSIYEVPTTLPRLIQPPKLSAAALLAGPLPMQQEVVAQRMWRCVDRRAGEHGRYWTESSLEKVCADDLISDATLAGGEARGKEIVATLKDLQFAIPNAYHAYLQ